jgi:hypothetical protein
MICPSCSSLFLLEFKLTEMNRRINKGSNSHASKEPINLLRDTDQPFIFDISFFNRPYRFEFYDTSSPENWTLVQPDVIVLCYDVSTRLSLINVQRVVCPLHTLSFLAKLNLPSGEKKQLTSLPQLKNFPCFYWASSGT